MVGGVRWQAADFHVGQPGWYTDTGIAGVRGTREGRSGGHRLRHRQGSRGTSSARVRSTDSSTGGWASGGSQPAKGAKRRWPTAGVAGDNGGETPPSATPGVGSSEVGGSTGEVVSFKAM